MVYQNLFTPKTKWCKQSKISADIVGHSHQDHTHVLRSRGISLLRTCQQIHEEGSAVLYGENIFWFDDIPYNEIRGMPPLDGLGINIVLPYCKITFMYAFLRIIGKTNRLRIRHLRIRFDRDIFATFPEECGAWRTWELDGVGGASYISDALDFLSDDHQLRSLKISFKGSTGGIAAFSIWVCEDSRMIRRLAQLESIGKFECTRVKKERGSWMEGLSDSKLKAYTTAVTRYKELKSKLEAAYSRANGRSSPSTTTYRLRSNPITQLEVLADK